MLIGDVAESMLKSSGVRHAGRRQDKLYKRVRREWPLYVITLPAITFFLVYRYFPMYGVIMAFQNFQLAKGFLNSAWVGLDNFRKFFGSSFFPVIMQNTVLISFYKILFGFPAPIVLALMLNAIRKTWQKRILQTVMYIPHFISWIVAAGLINVFFLPGSGVVPHFFSLFDLQCRWLVDSQSFRGFLVATEIWKSVGWGSIIYLAALSGVNPELYEAAALDGANSWHRMRYVTLPYIWPTILTMLILRIGNVLNAGFEQILTLQSNSTYMVSEVIDTYVYKQSFVNGKYGFGAAAGLFKSLVGMLLVIIANMVSKKSGEGRIW